MNQTVVLEFFDEVDQEWKRAGDFDPERYAPRRTKTRLVFLTREANRHE